MMSCDPITFVVGLLVLYAVIELTLSVFLAHKVHVLKERLDILDKEKIQ